MTGAEAPRLDVWGLRRKCFTGHASNEVREYAARLVPHLMELLAIPELPRRALILGLLAEVATGTGAVDVSRDPELPPEPDHAAVARARMLEALETPIRLLDDPKRKVAIRAAYLLSRLPDGAARSVGPLKARASTGDLDVRVAAVLAVGMLAPRENVEWFQSLEHPALRAAAAAGLARADVSEPDPKAVHAAAGAAVFKRLPWEMRLWDAFQESERWHRALAAELATAERFKGRARTEVRDAVLRWRTAAQEVVPILVDRAPTTYGSDFPGLVEIVAEAGEVSAEQADFLAEVLERGAVSGGRAYEWPPEVVAAIKSLALRGDARSLPWLESALLHPRIGDVGLPAAVAPMAAHADGLLAGLDTFLRGPELKGNRGFDLVEVIHALSAWGEAAAPLLPALTTKFPVYGYSIIVLPLLGAMGPAAAEAVPYVRGLLEHELEQPRAAWALWRITGDPGDAVAIITERLAQSGHYAGDLSPLLEDLGPPAASAVPHLRALLDDEVHGFRWDRVGIARALWAITGDADGLVEALLAAITVRPLPDHTLTSQSSGLRAVEALGWVGEAAVGAVPALRDIAYGPARVTWWDAFLDDRYRRAAVEALGRIEGQ
ncbi:hypothetical protein ACIBKY_00245 [Nonomuraea sp. NPDC050394]|uniref:hypothetical protein n=1 Tax=Nonomuraea sp. NPDC050394 TaxID=3364363 RepID=UPI00379E6BDE